MRKIAIILLLGSAVSCSKPNKVPQHIADMFRKAKRLGCIEITDVILDDQPIGNYILCKKTK